MTTTTTLGPLCLFALALAPAFAPAQTTPPDPPPDYGHDFVTIGAPGNRGVLPFEAPNWNFDILGTFGDVGYEYRVTRTEVTNAQYFEFLDIYTKIPGRATGMGILGFGIFPEGFDPQGNPILRITHGAEHAPANPSWEFAARYTNWLHNDKGTRLEDFETGVYDTSTFGVDPDTGRRSDQLERSPGARYFLPTFDEWVKAAHYDPDRYGEGNEGYWYYPGGSDDPLVSGQPGEPGAETGVGQDPDDYLYYPVGSYPGTNQPWGLLDTSGGTSEWLETVLDPTQPSRRRLIAGSDMEDLFGTLIDDRLDEVRSGLIFNQGFRVGSVVPAPGIGAIMLVGLVLTSTRRNRS